jgi:hypothetical protein
MHGRHTACWYHINYIESSERNLSHYLGLSKDEYHAALETMHLVKWAKMGRTERTLFTIASIPDRDGFIHSIYACCAICLYRRTLDLIYRLLKLSLRS